MCKHKWSRPVGSQSCVSARRPPSGHPVERSHVGPSSHNGGLRGCSSACSRNRASPRRRHCLGSKNKNNGSWAIGSSDGLFLGW